jgi:hypothetical protein
MKKLSLILFAVLIAAVLGPAAGMPGQAQQGKSSSQPVWPPGVVTKIQPGLLTLRTDAGTDLTIRLPEDVSVLRVAPGAKTLKSATKIAVSEIDIGDRVLVLGPVSDDHKSVLARRVIVMSKAALAQARETEQLEWERRGISGVVKSLDPATRQIVLAVPNTPPTPENPTHPVTISLEPQAELLRYAPDSVKFSDAKPSTFREIKVEDQVRALGNKSAAGTHFTAEKLVSGTFRNIGATVISVDAAQGTITVKDLATGKPLLVRTSADSQMHQLPPFLVEVIARFNSGGAAGNGAPGPSGHHDGGKSPGVESRQSLAGSGGHETGMGGPGAMGQGMARNFQQMLEKTPALTLGELEPGEPLIVVSTAGANPSEVTAIAVLSGVEPILRARPKGSKSVGLGPWNMSMGGGGGGGEEGP